LRIVDCGSSIDRPAGPFGERGAGLPIADCGLRIADCRLRIADCRLPIADCRLPNH
jgi:hypothetical protein